MRHLRFHIMYIMGILGISILVMLPMFLQPYHTGHDTKFHVANVLAIEEQIHDGKIPTSPIVDKVGYGLGYATRVFYPPLSHTVTAYIDVGTSHLGFNVLDTFKLVHFLVLFLSGLVMYLFAFKLSKNKVIAFFSAIIYMTFPYHLSDIYARDSFAECFLFIFIPMILSSLYSLFEGNTKRFYPLFVIGYVGGILAHFTMMIYLTLLLIPFLLVSYKKVFNRKFMIPFLIATISAIGISLFFVGGLLQHRIFGDYVVFEAGSMSKRIVSSALYPFEYLNIIPSLQGEVKHYFPLVTLILLLITFIKRKHIQFPKYTNNFILFGLLAFLLSTKIFPWAYIPSAFQMIQFPWRLEIFVGIIVSIYTPFCLVKVKKQVLVFLLIPIFLLAGYQASDFSKKGLMSLDPISWNSGMGWQKEYLPVVAKKNRKYLSKKKQRIDFIDGKGSYDINKNDVPQLEFSLQVNEPSVIELPRIYYLGYQLIDQDDQVIPLRSSKYGLLEATVTKSGNYYLNYSGSKFSKICQGISFFTLIISITGYGIYFVYQRRVQSIE